MNGPGGQKYLELAADEPIGGDWSVLALDELEALQPYLELGADIVELVGTPGSVAATVARLAAEHPDALAQSYVGRVATAVLEGYLGFRED